MEAIKSERDGSVIKRLIAVNMVCDKNCSTSLAAESVGTTQRSVQLWLERFDEYGVDGLRNLQQMGRPPLVSYERILKFANRLCKKGKIMPKIQKKIRDKCRIKYSMCNIRKIMNGFDFTPKAATRTLAKASSKSTCIKWQNQTEQDILDAKKRGFTIVVQDESIFTHDSKTGKKYRSRSSQKIHVKSTGYHTRMIVYGALADDGTQLFRLHQKFNGDTFLKYLKDIRLKWGKVMIIVDNAPQHKFHKVKEYLNDHKDVVLYNLSPYAPQLNAIEECWRQAKYELVHSESYETEEKMWDTLSEYFRNKRFDLDIYRYLERSL